MLSKYITVTIRKAISLLATGLGIFENMAARCAVAPSRKPISKRSAPPLHIN